MKAFPADEAMISVVPEYKSQQPNRYSEDSTQSGSYRLPRIERCPLCDRSDSECR